MGGRHSAPGPGAGADEAPADLPDPADLPRRADLRAAERARRGRRRAAPGTSPTRASPRSTGPRSTGPRRPLGATILGALLVVLAAAGLGLVGSSLLRSGAASGLLGAAPALTGAAPTADARAEDPGAGSSAAGAPSAVRAVQALLDQRAAALLARDRDGWLSAVGGDDAVTAPARPALDGYRERTASVFDRLAPVPLGTWQWEVTGSGPALAAERAQQLPAGSWVARTTLVWSVQGADDDPVRRQQDLTVVPAGAGWAVVDDADADTVPDLWDLGDVTVVRSERAVVLGTAGREELERAAEVATTGAEAVDAVWGAAWPRRTVVEVPADQAQMAALLGRDDDAGLDQIAAVTTGELVGGAGATRGDHVVVNPQGFGQLAPLGQRVVLTHELTHVATRAGAVRAVPLWLSEGFADWVGYQGTGLSRQVVAGDLLAQVGRSGAPAELPTAADFDPSRTSVGPAYSGAWLAVDSLARVHGDDAVVALYRAASRDPLPGATTADASEGSGDDAAGDDAAADAAGTDEEQADAALDAALASVMGTDRDTVVAGWRAELVRLAGGQGSG